MHHLTFHSFILSILCPPPPISYFTPFLIFLSLLNPHSVTFTSLCLLSLRCFCPPIENSNCPLASDWFYWPAPQPVSWRLTRSPLVALNASDNKETGFLPCENEPAHTQGHTHTRTHTHQAHLVSQAKPLSISQVLGLIKLKTGCRCTSVGVCVQWRVRNSPCVHWCKAKCVCTCAFSYMCMCVCMTAPSSRSLLVQH